MRQRILTIFLIILSFGVGIFIGVKIKKTNAPAGTNNTYQAGWDGAMKALGESGGVPIFPEGIEIKSLNGAVSAASGNAITVKVSTPGLIGTPELVTRTVTVSNNTKIVRLVQKDPAQFQKEMQEFQDKIKQQQGQPLSGPQDLPTPPEFQDKKDANIGDIKVGQMIMVQSGEDIKNKQQFVATEIQIQTGAPSIPAGSAPQSPVAPASPVPVK